MIGRLMGNKNGTVLVVAMILMTALAIIGIAANTNVITDTGIASNYLSSVQSFYIAEAGLERAKMECAERFRKEGWSDLAPILRGADDIAGTGDDGILSFGSKVSFHGGHYSVRVKNETGVGGADGNTTVTLVSRGSFGNSTTALKSTIAINVLPYLPGSVNLVGNGSAHFANDSFSIDGRDYLLSDGSKPNGTAAARSGISICDVQDPELAKEQIISSLKEDQTPNIQGSEPNPSIGVSTKLTKESLKQFINALKKVADNRIADPGDSLSTTGPDNSVNVGALTYLGTALAPKVTHISKPGGGTVTLNGSGSGLLMIEGNNLCFRPNIDFTGVVILSGKDVVLDDSGVSSGLQLKGGLIVVETSGSSGAFNLVISGKSRIRFSQEAIDRINDYLANGKKYSVLSWERSY